MSIFVWVMMAIAVWHFTVWVPDHFWGGIVGAFVAAIIGSLVFCLAINGFNVVGRTDLELIHAIEAIPGAALGLAVCWWYGKYREENPKRKKRRSGGTTARVQT